VTNEQVREDSWRAPDRPASKRTTAVRDPMKDRLDHLAHVSARADARAAAVAQRRRLRGADRLEPRSKPG
jgi:hypothetical protein